MHHRKAKAGKYRKLTLKMEAAVSLKYWYPSINFMVSSPRRTKSEVNYKLYH